jgi:hypothetical protein
MFIGCFQKTKQKTGLLVIIIFSDLWHAMQEFVDYHQSIIDHNQNNEERYFTKLRTHAIDRNPRIRRKCHHRT